MSIIYGITMGLALGLFVGYVSLVKKKGKYLIALYVSVFIVNLGYFMLSLSKNLTFALISNCIAYLGSVFLPMFMFLTITKLCGFKYSKVLPIILLIIGGLVFALVCTQGWLPWYYKEVGLAIDNGVATLVKVYGPLHIVYLIYLVSYFALMIGSIIHSAVIKKGKAIKHAIFLLSVVFFNIIVWFIEKYVPFSFEFLAISYIISELMLLVIHWMIQDYILISKYPKLESGEGEMEPCDRVLNVEESMIKICNYAKEKLTAREKEVLKAVLEYKRRKEIAEEMNVSENTVKTHTAHIFDKLGVSSRQEIIELANSL